MRKWYYHIELLNFNLTLGYSTYLIVKTRIEAEIVGESGEVALNKLYNKRYNIFLAAEKMPIHPLMKVIFRSMASDVKLVLLLFKLRQDFEEQISRIITMIDSIEDEIKTMKENLNINLR